MEPEGILTQLDDYVDNLQAQEIRDLFELYNEMLDRNLYIQDGQDEVDLVDGH